MLYLGSNISTNSEKNRALTLVVTGLSVNIVDDQRIITRWRKFTSENTLVLWLSTPSRMYKMELADFLGISELRQKPWFTGGKCQLRWEGGSSEDSPAPGSLTPGNECWPEEAALRAAEPRRSRRGRRWWSFWVFSSSDRDNYLFANRK